jgi:phospholipid/cholesterol/gamma-HCH transport system substrate-binding protein
MKSKYVEIKVGIFVILGAVILIFGFLWIKQVALRKTGYILSVHFDNAAGLKRGDPMRVRGVDVGRVVSIELQQEYVDCKCYIEEWITLKKDATAAIKDVALISGTKYIELDVGTGKEPLDIEKPLEGKGTSAFSLGELGDILEPIRRIAEKLSKGELDETLENINVASRELASLVRENRPGIRRTVREAEQDLKRIVEVADNLDKNLDLLYDELTLLNKGEGTMGKLMKDEKMYNELEQTLKETKALIKDIKENPKRYIHIRLF